MEGPDALREASLFRRLLGAAAFDALPPEVQRLHLRPGHARYRGEVDIARGHGLLSRLCAWATRLPKAGVGPIEVEIVAEKGRETWTRHVGAHAMRSRLWAGEGLLREKLGLVTFGFRLSSEHEDIVWRVERVRALGLPLPAAWFSQVRARESAEGGRYRFEVVAALPLAGPLVHYRGVLDVD